MRKPKKYGCIVMHLEQHGLLPIDEDNPPAGLRDMLGNSNCICEGCKILARKFWYPRMKEG